MNSLSLISIVAIMTACLIGTTMAGSCPGYCQHTSIACPTGAYRPHLCPGPANIECCPASTPSCAGQCQEDNLPCDGHYESHQCPGGANVRCCTTGGGGGGCRSFADSQWNCASPSCATRVAAGSPQPNYGCAEFTARALASGGHIPGLAPLASQGAFANYGYGGKTYDLCWTSHRVGGPLGLEDFLRAKGWREVGTATGFIGECSAVFVTGGEPWGHVVVGIGANVLDAHNNARLHVSGGFYSINTIWNPPSIFANGTSESIDQFVPLPTGDIKPMVNEASN